jgi:hypothetical protein
MVKWFRRMLLPAKEFLFLTRKFTGSGVVKPKI